MERKIAVRVEHQPRRQAGGGTGDGPVAAGGRRRPGADWFVSALWLRSMETLWRSPAATPRARRSSGRPRGVLPFQGVPHLGGPREAGQPSDLWERFVVV